MYLELIKSDIRRIGSAAYENDEGNCVFVFNGGIVYQIEYIFLRNILKLFGQQYRIISEDEYIDAKNRMTIFLTSNLPWEMYMAEDIKRNTEE